jgi:hypothetical protein
MVPRKGWLVGLFLFLGLAGLARAQLVLGQYEDEAPVRTWNTFGLTSAASSGLAETRYALAQDPTAVSVNPALAVRLPGFSLAVTGSYQAVEFFRYAAVNTGVVTTDGNISLGLWSADSAALSLRWRGWGIGLAYGLLETYERPTIDVAAGPDYAYHFDQTGALKVISLSLARSLGPRLALGVGVNVVTGSLDHLGQDLLDGGLDTVIQSIGQKYSGFYVTGGLLFDVTPSIHLGAAARTPYVKKADSRSIIRWTSVAGPNIEIDAASEDESHEPFVGGVGLSVDLTPEWVAALDATYFNWSSYKVAYFGRELRRDFRDVVKLTLGTRYSLYARLFGWNLRFPVRAGLQVDPQPMKTPSSSYFYYAFGTGIHGRYFFFDISLVSGKESGSGHALVTKCSCLSLGATI